MSPTPWRSIGSVSAIDGFYVSPCVIEPHAIRRHNDIKAAKLNNKGVQVLKKEKIKRKIFQFFPLSISTGMLSHQFLELTDVSRNAEHFLEDGKVFFDYLVAWEVIEAAQGDAVGAFVEPFDKVTAVA
jgi:hypothetical protein